jgi:heme oxygenase
MVVQLSRATAVLRAQLVALLEWQAAAPSRDKYATLLRSLYSIVPAVERRIADVPGWSEYGVPMKERGRSDQLARDLRGMGMPLPPLCAAAMVPAIATTAQAFGAAFALQDLRWDGAALARRLGATLGMSERAGLCYLSATYFELRSSAGLLAATLELWAREATPSQKRASIATATATLESIVQLCARAAEQTQTVSPA